MSTDALDRLVASCWDCAARTALMEAHSLLQMRRHDDAADALLTHYESILARARTHIEAQQVIAKAKEEA